MRLRIALTDIAVVVSYTLAAGVAIAAAGGLALGLAGGFTVSPFAGAW